MSEAVRVGDLTAHGTPIQGQGSPDVFIGNMKAWRAIPADVGGGLEEASKQVKAIMDKFPSVPSPSDPSQVATKDLTEIFQKMLDTATKAEAASGMCGAMAGVQSAFMSFQPTALGLLATYTTAAAAPAPGAEVAARLAFTAAFQAGLGAAMSAAVTAIAGGWDMNNCPAAIPGPPPHGPGLVTVGCKTIFINKMPAVVKGHKIIEAAGGPNTVQIGCGNVFFGDKAPSAGASAGAKSGGKSQKDDAEVKGELKGGHPDVGTNAGGETSPKDAGGPSASNHYDGHLLLSSEATETYPTPRSRATVGVGEIVVLSASRATGNLSWTVEGKGSLNLTSGTSVELTAGEEGGSATVTVTDSCGCEASVTFQVLEPSGVRIIRAPETKTAHKQGIASIGIIPRIYITPVTVSFMRVKLVEDDCVAQVTGYFTKTKLNGVHHKGRGAGKEVRGLRFVEGMGTLFGDDEVRCGPLPPPYSHGTFHWAIPWRFKVGAGSGKIFATVHQFFSIDANGDMTASKGAGKDKDDYAKGEARLQDATINYL